MKSAFRVGFIIAYGSGVDIIDKKDIACEEWFNQYERQK